MNATEVLFEHPEAIVKAYFKDKDGRPLILADYQIDFIKTILQRKKHRIIFVAATQTGKSEAIATAIALLVLFYPNERVINVSYTEPQARIIFERVKSHLVDDSPEIAKYVDLDRSFGKAKEFSKTRMFLKNKSEARVLSVGSGETEKTGDSLLGHEGTVVIIDEASSIPNEVFTTKILRMIGAKRTTGFAKTLILSGTPQRAGSYFEEAWYDPTYTRFRVGWKQAVDAGRLDIKTVEEQRRKMTRSQFEAWYEAMFPSMMEDSVFDMEEVKRNIVEENLEFKGKKILSVDIARFGNDFCIYTMFDLQDMVFRVVKIISDDHRTLMATTGRILDLHKKYNFDRIMVDASGVGGGVYDRLNEQGIKVFSIVAGSKCSSQEIAKDCLNLKAELYMKAKKLFEEDRLKIINHPILMQELRSMRKEFQSNGKVKIIDPDKSPDYASSLVYGLYEPIEGTFIIVNMNGPEQEGIKPKWHTI